MLDEDICDKIFERLIRVRMSRPFFRFNLSDSKVELDSLLLYRSQILTDLFHNIGSIVFKEAHDIITT